VIAGATPYAKRREREPVTAVRFAEPGFPESRGHIRVCDDSLLGRI
jgi:hypothetical protein